MYVQQGTELYPCEIQQVSQCSLTPLPCNADKHFKTFIKIIKIIEHVSITTCASGCNWKKESQSKEMSNPVGGSGFLSLSIPDCFLDFSLTLCMTNFIFP